MVKSITIIYSLIFAILFLPTLSHAWLIYHKPAFKGKVIDSETKKPIENAVVVVVYNKTSVVGFEPSTSLFDIKETLTDIDGIFVIPSYTTTINPFSVSAYVNFIIFKPGYGEYTPVNIKPGTEFSNKHRELFFSEDFGRERELWLNPNPAEFGSKREMFKVTFGIVELRKLKTTEERKRNIPSLPSTTKLLEKQKNLIRLINEENENLGLKKTDPYKARDFILHRERQ